MDFEELWDNFGLIVIGVIWVLSALRGVFARKRSRTGARQAGRRGRRGRALFFAFVLLALAIAAWEFSGSVAPEEAGVLRILAGTLAAVAFLVVLFSGLRGRRQPVQGDVGMQEIQERSDQIRAAEPFEPR